MTSGLEAEDGMIQNSNLDDLTKHSNVSNAYHLHHKCSILLINLLFLHEKNVNLASLNVNSVSINSGVTSDPEVTMRETLTVIVQPVKKRVSQISPLRYNRCILLIN